ncbi:MAG: ATP-binding protein [Marinoscillum sp.]
MINRVFNLGITEQLRIEDAQLVRITNVLALFPVPVYLFYIGYAYFFSQWFSAALAGSMIVLTIIAISLNSKQLYGLAKFTLFWLNGFSLWVTYHVFNVDYSVLMSFFPILFCYAFFFDLDKERYVFVGSLSFTLFFLLSSFILPKQLFYSINLSPEDALVSNYFHVAFSFVLTGLVVWYLIKNNRSVQKKLIDSREEALTFSRLQSEFLANMSHEIRTPLNGIIGFSDLLFGTKLNEEQKEYAQTIDFSSKMLLDIVNNVLDLSKLEAKKIFLEEHDFEIRHTLEQLIQINRQKTARGVKLLHQIADDVHPHLHGDEKRFKQVVNNLINNSLKFTKKGKVEILMTVDELLDDRIKLKVTVSDTGIGIPENQQDKLFTRFYQVQSSSRRAYSGSGLGLVIAKSLTELMNGTISFTSQEGKGTSFEICVPFVVARGTDMITEQPPNISNKSRDLKILVAEDNRINQIVISKILEKKGFEIDLANNGFEVVEMTSKKKYDLILMDVQMPGKDGVEATKEILLSHNERPVIIALTANALKEDRDKCLEAGMNDYLSKPISKEQIDLMLNKWF